MKSLISAVTLTLAAAASWSGVQGQETNPPAAGRGAAPVHVYLTAARSHFSPDRIEVNEGDTVNLHITSLEQAGEQPHGFAIDMYNLNLSLGPGRPQTVSFVADKAGVFPLYCTGSCSALHLEMTGYLLVKPKR